MVRVGDNQLRRPYARCAFVQAPLKKQPYQVNSFEGRKVAGESNSGYAHPRFLRPLGICKIGSNQERSATLAESDLQQTEILPDCF